MALPRSVPHSGEPILRLITLDPDVQLGGGDKELIEVEGQFFFHLPDGGELLGTLNRELSPETVLSGLRGKVASQWGRSSSTDRQARNRHESWINATSSSRACILGENSSGY